MQSEGKTITAINLAIIMAKDFGLKTLIFEGDFRRPSISRYIRKKSNSGLVNLLDSKIDIQSTIIPVADAIIPFIDDNLSILPAAKRTQNSSSLLSSQRTKDLLKILRAQYDFILIDAPPILPLSDMNIFEELVDGIIMVVRAENTPRGAFLKALDNLGTEKIIGIVLNDVRQILSSYYKYGYKYEYKYDVNS